MDPFGRDDERATLSNAARGDKIAMRTLYERHHDALYAFLRTRCDDDGMAMDAVQDTMLAVWRSAGKFSGKSSVRTWIFAIGRNKLIDRMRRVSQMTYVEEVPEEADDAPDAEHHDRRGEHPDEEGDQVGVPERCDRRNPRDDERRGEAERTADDDDQDAIEFAVPDLAAA